MTQQDLEALCLSVYRETSEHPAIVESRERFNLGYEILMGPPCFSPELVFIGYQPGNWKLSAEEARHAGYEASWVSEKCQYVTEEWKLARRLRKLFTAERLERCVGLNAIFVRARSVAEYRRVPIELRDRIQTFCRSQLKRLLDAMAPKKIVVIGFGTMRLLGDSTPELLFEGKVLIRRGSTLGRNAYATPHLSGAWGLRKQDTERIGKYLLCQSD